jgi:hypothetical protein
VANLTQLLNKWLLRDRTLPEKLMQIRMMFILKEQNGLPPTLNTCRPISITSVFVKILERIMQGRFKALTKEGTIKPVNPAQTGF